MIHVPALHRGGLLQRRADDRLHNHARQGSLALESRRTVQWDWRFFQTFLGIVEVDAFTALLNNKVGVTDSSPVLRPRDSGAPAAPAAAAPAIHDVRLLKQAEHFVSRGTEHPVLHCRVFHVPPQVQLQGLLAPRRPSARPRGGVRNQYRASVLRSASDARTAGRCGDSDRRAVVMTTLVTVCIHVYVMTARKLAFQLRDK